MSPHSQTVPVEPTEAMLKALAGEPLLLAASDRDELLLRYRAMLAAAPEQGGPEEADAKDAARYRWLRAHSWIDTSIIKSVLNFGPGYDQTKPEILDAAVDADMSHATEGTGK